MRVHRIFNFLRHDKPTPSLLILVLLCAFPIRAAEYQISGTLSYDEKTQRSRVFPPTLFTLTVSNNFWNLRSVELLPEVQESDLSEGVRKLLGPENVKSALQRQYRHKNVTSDGEEVHSVWFHSITNGALGAEPEPPDRASIQASVIRGNQPPHYDSRSLHLWEALASFPVLNLGKEGHPPQPWHAQPHPGVLDDEEHRVSMESSVTRMSGEPRLPKSIIFTTQEGKLAGKYEVLEQTNLHGMMIPTRFSLEVFKYDVWSGTADTNLLWITMSTEAVASSFPRGFNFKPGLPSGANVADFRFRKKETDSVLIYNPKGEWLPTNAVPAKPVHAVQPPTVKPQLF